MVNLRIMNEKEMKAYPKPMSDGQAAREHRDRAIFEEYSRLIARKEQKSRTEVVKFLADKHGFCVGNIYRICREYRKGGRR